MDFNSLQSGAPGGFQSFRLGKRNVAWVFCFPGLDLIEMTKGSDILLKEGTHRNGRQYNRKIPTLPISMLEILLGFFLVWQQMGKYYHFYLQLSSFLECSMSLNREDSEIIIPLLYLPLRLILALIIFHGFRRMI